MLHVRKRKIFIFPNIIHFNFRPDNADLRLTAKAQKFGIISDKRWEHFQRMLSRMEILNERLESLKFTSAGWNEQIPGLDTPGIGKDKCKTL